MSMLQVEELVSYQLRTAYLSEIADGVGERLITLNEGFLSTAPFKAAGWRANPAHIKRTHSPPIPTAVASEYFQAPRAAVTLEDDQDDGVQMAGSLVAPKRRRRREQMEEEDSSDLSDESDDDEPNQRAAQQIKFAKMPLRHRSGSSPIQSSNLRQTANVASPQRAPAPRRGSQSALETVKERARRDTVTSSEVSSDTDFDASLLPQPNRPRTATAPGPGKTVRLQVPRMESEPSMGINRVQSEPLAEEQEDSDASDMSSAFVGSIDSASLLDPVEEPPNPSPTRQIVGTPPRQFTRSSTIRKSQAPPMKLHSKLPPPRPMSTVRPLSVIQPMSLLSVALKAKKTKPAHPFESFASLSGQGDPNPIRLRIYPTFSGAGSEPLEVLIRRTVHEGQNADRPVAVADLIGLSLWRYTDEKRDPPLPADKLNVNWWTLRMAEEGGEVDDDFPPLERKKQLTSFTTANNRAARARANSKVYDEFALVQASPSEFAENQKITPQFTEEASAEQANEEELTPRNTPQPNISMLSGANPQASASTPTLGAGVGAGVSPAPTFTRGTTFNPIITTTFNPNTTMADSPAAPISLANPTRGRKKLLRIHIMSSDLAPGQMITLDVTTSTYMEEVLDLVCKKRQLDKAAHVLRMPGSGGLVVIDRRVSSLGNVSDLELHRRRFATEGSSFAMTGSPSSSSPKPALFYADGGGLSSQPGIGIGIVSSVGGRRSNLKKMAASSVTVGGGEGGASGSGFSGGYQALQQHQQHPLAQQTSNQDEEADERSKKYVVYRRQTMRGVLGGTERILSIEGEYVHIVPSSSGRATLEPGGKTVTVHFSNVIGCKVSRRHPTYIKFNVFTNAEKRYEFEAKSATEAAEIVYELKNRIAPYRDL